VRVQKALIDSLGIKKLKAVMGASMGGLQAKTFGTAPADEGKDPTKAFTNQFKIESFLDQAAAGRAVVSDANHFLYLCKANQLASVDPTKIKVPTLVLYTPNDLIFYEPIVEDSIQKIAAAGTPVESGTLP